MGGKAGGVRRAAGLLPLVALVAFLAACGGGGGRRGWGGPGAERWAADRKGAVLSLYGFGQGDDVAMNRAKVAKAAIAPATVKNPEGAFNPQQFLTRLASGEVPDVIYLDRQQVATLAAQNALEPLDQCVKDQSVPTSQYNKAAINEVTYQGKLYAMPEFTNQRTLIVNDGAAADAGVKPSEISTTDWAKLKELAKKMTKMSGGKPTRIGFD